MVKILREKSKTKKIRSLFLACLLTACQEPDGIQQFTPPEETASIISSQSPILSSHQKSTIPHEESPSLTLNPSPIPETIQPKKSSTLSTATPWPMPTPIAGDICYQKVNDLSLYEPVCGELTGTVYDDEDQPVSGATVNVSLEDETRINKLVNPPYLYAKDFIKIVTTDAEGKFRLRYPFGETSLQVSKPGYTERSMSCSVFTPHQERQICDFKRFPQTDVWGYAHDYRLSKKPEVTEIRQLFENPQGFQLTFSKPVKPEQIQSRLLVSFFARSRFMVDQGAAKPVLSQDYQTEPHCTPYCGIPIFDGSFFNVQSNTAQDILTFTLKPGYRLPNDDQESMDYRLTFGQVTEPYARDILDLEGNVRNQGHFRMGNQNRDVNSNSIYATSQGSIKLQSISAHNAGLRLHYDGLIYFKTLQALIAGGMADRDNVPEAISQAPAAYPHAPNATPRNTADNYTVTTPHYSTTWKALGGTAVYADDDPLHQQVLLNAPINEQTTHTELFLSFNTISTAPTQASLNLDAPLSFDLSLIDYTGKTTAYTLNFNPGEANGAEGLATRVARKLNALQKGNWQVKASTDQRVLHITWSTPTVDDVAWKGTWNSTSASLPTAWATPTHTWDSGSPLARFKPGDNISITVRETVLSPEGIPISPDGRQVQWIWQ